MVGYQDDGRRKYKTFYGKTKTEVQKKLREYQVAKENGELIGMDYRFAEWADFWFENHKDNIRPTTQESYRYTLKILKDHQNGRSNIIRKVGAGHGPQSRETLLHQRRDILLQHIAPQDLQIIEFPHRLLQNGL